MTSKSIQILASVARTATPSPVLLNAVNLSVDYGQLLNLHLFIDVTAINLTPSLVITIDAEDPISGKFYNLLTSAAITTVSTNTLRLGKDIDTITNLSQLDFIPKEIRISFTHGDADSITYSVGMNYQV
jgi:hypothetical protein